ncbi:MAG: C-5 cytosine-specific DNA methylase [Candidatus Methanofastidiosum methylothiophilum]|uniref:C-5 cytosine-specific DNA methylase n=1 Tax=Candidatus Methanofastidiosum methylothiophilum TaxID=1705564 RepID=A0A150IH92_9EURY|nr:MAG: C-5 cytosine-specific DNA methylase [Candidatus Methanofastidiosum methylthiophilus]
MKILNLYAGIGGNRKLWEDVEVTAVELNPKIAEIYQRHFPNDKLVVGDAHQYLLEHFREYDFIWASPPCPTHSRFKFLHNAETEGLPQKFEYPDMTLYQEIIHLSTWYKGLYCVENVISYYKPLIPPIESNSHYFWTNFYFRPFPNMKRGIRGEEQQFRKGKVGFDLEGLNLPKAFEKKIINNCVEPEVGKYILDVARNSLPPIQEGLFTEE